MTIPVLMYMLLSCITALVVPWLGAIFYYLLAVSQAQDMWPEAFGDSRASLYISLAVIAGLGVATATRQVDWRRLFALPNLGLMLVVVLFNLSILNSPFANFFDVKIATLSSAEQSDVFNKMVLIYFVAVLLIDTRFKLIVLIVAIGGVFVYYTFWANKIYFTGEFWRFGDNGRLNGPWGLYYDENYFAMLFLFLSWHGLFLTGSRGALLALAVTCLYIFVRSYSRFASIAGAVALVCAIAFQSGNLIDRVSNTVSAEDLERDRAFIENSDESEEIDGKAIDPRLLSWRVGLKIMAEHPVMGVGAGNFMRAWPEFDQTEPHVAHNTFVQIGASCGILAALIYAYLFWLRFRNMIAKPDPEKKYAFGHKRDYLDDLINSLFIAFYMVALFLDLFILEVTYFVFLCGTCKYLLDRRKKRSIHSLIASIYRWRQGDEEDKFAPARQNQSVLAADGPVTADGGPVTMTSSPVTVYSASFAANNEVDSIHVIEEDEQQAEQGNEPPVSQYAPSRLYANK